MIKRLLLSCQKATFLISKKEVSKLTFNETFNLSLHLTLCKFCKLFEKQFVFISSQAKHIHSHSSAKLSPEDKARIAEVLKQNDPEIF